VDRYEQLRERALAGDASGWRCGLAILQHRGVAAWLRAWQNLPASGPAERPTRATTSPQPVPGIAECLVEALATMALAVAAGR
jgi:predicted MFS family arabinose efflux permease